MLLVQGLLLLFDGVIDYFPCPIEASNNALNQSKNGGKVLNSKKLNSLLSWLLEIAIGVFNLAANY